MILRFKGKKQKGPLFKDVAEEWRVCKKRTLKDSSYGQFVRNLNKHILPSIGEKAIGGIPDSMLDELIDDLFQKGLSSKTVHEILLLVKSILRHTDTPLACRLDKIKVSAEKHNPQVLTKEEEKKMRNCLTESLDRIKLGILICMTLGIRIGELCALKWKNIDLKNAVLKVQYTVQRIQDLSPDGAAKTKVTETSPKSSGSVREIPIPKSLVKMLAKFQSESDAYFLTGTPGQCVEPRTVQRRFQKYLNECGLSPVNFHAATRHTFATRWIGKGGDAKSLSEVLGHSDVALTMRLYVHPCCESKREHMEKMCA